MDMAVDSSMISCAAANRRQPPSRSSSVSRNPYSAFRAPSMIAVAAPANGAPPPATTPTSPNWLPPVNINNDSAIVCARSNPPANAIAPNEMPYAPVAIDTPAASRSTVALVTRQSASESIPELWNQVGQQGRGALAPQPDPPGAVREPKDPGQFPAGEFRADGEHRGGRGPGYPGIDAQGLVLELITGRPSRRPGGGRRPG